MQDSTMPVYESRTAGTPLRVVKNDFNGHPSWLLVLGNRGIAWRRAEGIGMGNRQRATPGCVDPRNCWIKEAARLADEFIA
ncbi:putative polysaccharide deacetylase YxkH [Trichinella spiralis]|uniref:Polysaccharide deacetylase YxkH n=1 Tax=Trichinella spiralis TaxID=6334 RepID=A0ABR3K8U6_TRISP